jgi:hypothetical protein
MAFNVEAARAGGVSEEDIQAILASEQQPTEEVVTPEQPQSQPQPQPQPELAPKKESNFNVEAARAGGVSEEDIQAILASEQPQPELAPKKESNFNVEAARAGGVSEEDIQAILASEQQDINPEEESSWFDKYVLDTAISTTQGVVGLAEAGVGLLDIPTMGYAGKGLEWAQNEIFGGDTQDLNAWLQKFKTPEQLTAEKELEDVKGFLPTIKELATNPAALTNMVFQTLPQMAGGWGIARKLLTEAGKRGSKKLTELAAKELYKKNAIRAAAAGEGAIAAGAAAEGIRQQTEDGLLSPKQAAMSVATGVGTAVLGIAGGKARSKTWL